MQIKERLAQEQRDAALLNRLVPPTPLPAGDSEPLQPETTAQDHTWDDDPDEIFRSAVSEIETQPLPPQPQETPWPVVVLLLAFLVSFVGGTVIALITYPTVTIAVVPVTKSVSVTMPLALSTRALAPVTLTRSETAPTTGKGHQEARAAIGSVTVYNGLFTAQTLPAGTVLTGVDGVQIATDAPVTIPAGHPPLYGQATVGARALKTGKAGNIGAGDITLTVSSGVLVKNSVLSGGREARDFRAVAQADLAQVTATLKGMLDQQMPLAFTLRPGEAVQPLDCAFNVTPTHHVGEEAATVTVQATATCQGMAYDREQLNQRATQAFIAQASPGVPYHLVGEVQVQVVSTTPLTVSCRGLWAYTLSPDYEQFLAERIAGDSPQQARKYLLHTGFLTRAIVPDTLPRDPAHIHFQVFIGL